MSLPEKSIEMYSAHAIFQWEVDLAFAPEHLFAAEQNARSGAIQGFGESLWPRNLYIQETAWLSLRN
jgi:hypothetical protein